MYRSGRGILSSPPFSIFIFSFSPFANFHVNEGENEKEEEKEKEKEAALEKLGRGERPLSRSTPSFPASTAIDKSRKRKEGKGEERRPRTQSRGVILKKSFLGEPCCGSPENRHFFDKCLGELRHGSHENHH